MASSGGEQRLKSDASKKLAVIKELQQTKIKIQNIEREKVTHIYSKHGEFRDIFAQLQELEVKGTRDRQTEKVKLQQQLAAMRHKIHRFQRELHNIKATPEFVEKLKEIMEDVEKNINEFKEKQKQEYEDLIKEEKIVTQEVQALDKKFELWSLQKNLTENTNDRPKPVSSASNRDVTKDLPAEVAAFDRFVEQSGGVRGGWDEYDHSTFMKFRIKHKGKPSFVRDLIPNLPTRSERQIVEHERWYQQYLELNDEKKEAIHKWRDRKLAEKEQVLAQAEVSDSDDEEARRNNDHVREALERERQERMGELNRWKIDKELAKAQEEERRLRQEIEKGKREDKRRKEKAAQRVLVEEYKRRKEDAKLQREHDEAVRTRIEAESRRQLVYERVKFQQRDMDVLKRKVADQKAQEEKEVEKRKRQQRMKGRVEANVHRDPKRLLQPTAGWIERQTDQTPTNSGGPLLHMPHRAIPAWRQEMK